MDKIKDKYIFVFYNLIVLFLILIFLFPNQQSPETNDFLADFFNHVYYVKDLNPYNWGIINGSSVDRVYPPINYLMFYYFSKISPYPNIVHYFGSYFSLGLMLCMSFFTICYFILFSILYKVAEFKKAFLVVFSLLLSGLFITSFERGNIVILSIIAISLFMFRDKLKINENLSALILAFACALKLTPVIFSLLYLYKKEYKSFFKFILFFIILLFIPFIFFKGGFQNIPLLYENLKLTAVKYEIANLPSLFFGTQIHNLIFQFLYLKISFWVSVIALITNFSVKDKFEQIMQLVLSVYLIFSNNGLYVLMLIFPCFILFLNKNKENKIDWFYLFCFIIIFNPIQIIIANQCINYLLIKVFALLFLIVLTIRSTKSCYLFFKNKV